MSELENNWKSDFSATNNLNTIQQTTPIAPKPTSPKNKTLFQSENFSDWVILGFIFNITLVLLFIFIGIIDVNIAYAIKYFFQYVVIALTGAIVLGGLIEWALFKQKKMSFFSAGMVICILLFLVIVSITPIIPELNQISNSITANDGPFTKESVQIKFVEMNDYYDAQKSIAQQNNSFAENGAINTIYLKSTKIGKDDVTFFSSKLNESNTGINSGVKLYSLTVVTGLSPSSMAYAVSKFGSLPTTMTDAELLLSLDSNVDLNLFMTNILTSNIDINSANIIQVSESLQKVYPQAFWNESAIVSKNYLLEFIVHKKLILETELNAKNTIDAFLIAQQINVLQQAYKMQ